ncbi:MAG: RNase P modulator RnpM [Ktedonobacteraceae bacterium]
MAKTQPKRIKPPPMRTCIACRESKPKRELLRIVRTPDGHVLLDATGKKAGRGAYLCAKLSCWENALKRKRLEQTFEVAISSEDQAALHVFIATLPPDEPVSAAPSDTLAKSAGKKHSGEKSSR